MGYFDYPVDGLGIDCVPNQKSHFFLLVTLHEECKITYSVFQRFIDAKELIQDLNLIRFQYG